MSHPLKKILLVDDVEDFVDLMKIELESWGFEVMWAYDGKQGLDKAKTFNPDLILLDIMMPQMNGFEMYSALQKESTCQNIPVIMISGKGDATTRKKASDLGVNAYLRKDELYGKLQGLLKHLLPSKN